VGGLKSWIASEARRARESSREFLSSPRAWYKRRVLWLRTVLFLSLLMVITGVASAHLYVLLSDRAGEVRSELFQRDLRDLVGRFDADERFVINNNPTDMVQERRALKPLLLPRQYYQALPSTSAQVLPRQPPRNCFVQLDKEAGGLTGDRICAYFAENRAFGRFLFLAATIAEEDVVPLKPGDIKMAADAMRLTIGANGHTQTWWMTYQVPPNYQRPDRFELTSFREVGDGQRDRDRRIEGWAYVQRQSKGSRVYVVARVDFREFMDENEDQAWPPPNWRNTRLSIERQDVSSNPPRQRTIKYRQDGVSELSLSALGSQIFNAYGSIRLERTGAEKAIWPVIPPPNLQEKFEPSPIGMKISDGDLLWPAAPKIQSEPLPDTDLVLTVSHPWTLIERGFWKILLYLIVLLIGGAYATWYFSKRLLRPISDWSQYSEQIASARIDKQVELPYADRHDEVGVLASAINALINRVREQTARAQLEREARAADERRKLQEEVENQRQNLKLIGHEIRSPLMSLLARHRDPEDRSRRYIERMIAALPHLMGGASASDAFDSRKLVIDELDLATFLVEVAENAEHAEIVDVKYSGVREGVRVLADASALEDALTNILSNANRHRNAGTEIQIILRHDAELAIVEVWDDGDFLPEENLERIFDLGYTTAPKVDEQGQGAGLHIARKYLRRMGGTVEARNHPRGAVFTLTLPIAPSLI